MFTPFGLERYFAAHEFNARHLLCTSDCESMRISELLALGGESAAETLARTWLGYTESRGAPALRKKIADLYTDIKPDEVLVHAGAEEAILNLFMAEIGPDDTVIVGWPCYQSLYEIPRSLGAKMRLWAIRKTSTRWYFDPDDLARLLAAEFENRGSNHVKMVVLNIPHNPTGALMTRSELQRVVSLCDYYGVLLLVDEVYRLLELHGAERLPAICEIYQNGISLSVLSKSWGLAGLRIGWLASRRTDVLDHVAAAKDYNSICASAPSETLACIALDRSSAILAHNRSICERNWGHFKALFDTYQNLFEYIPPQAGSVAFPALRDEGLRFWKDTFALSSELLEDTGALLLPGSLYGEEFARHFRIGLGRVAAKIGIEAFENWLARKVGRR